MSLLQIKFPYPPYDLQLKLIQFIREEYSNNQSVLIESPTGTGKSLVIIFSAYGILQSIRDGNIPISQQLSQQKSLIPSWIKDQHQQNTYQSAQQESRAVHDFINDFVPLSDTIKTKDQLDSILPHFISDILNTISYRGGSILYSSRTHLQCQQIQKDINKYTKLKTSVIAGRNHFCIHTQRDIEDILDIDQFCKDQVCLYRQSGQMFNFAIECLKNNYDFIQTKQKGIEKSTCPYYAQQIAQKMADCVLMSHNSFVNEINKQESIFTRENQIIMVDESHNLINLIEQNSDIRIDASQFTKFNQLVNEYIQEKSDFIVAKDIFMLNQLLAITKKLNNLIKRVQIDQSDNVIQGIVLNQFLTLNKLDNLNIQIYLLQFKQKRFVYRISKNDQTLFYKVINFLDLLSKELKQNLILILNSSSIRISSLNSFIKPSQHIQSPLMLLGGTMQPFKTFNNIFPTVNFKTYEGDSILSQNSLQVIINKDFLFTLPEQSVNNLQKIRNLINKCRSQYKDYEQTIVFFPSKRVLNKFKDLFNQTNFLFESQDAVQQLKTLKNGIFFGVLGGNFSEGIDFKDDLCRLLIIVGVPLANIQDPIVQARGNYNEKAFRLVNQAIGRAVRWQGDFSDVILLDKRYNSNKYMLSKWIRDRIVNDINKINCNLD